MPFRHYGDPMARKQLIVPYYCQHCQHLTFLVREGEPFEFRLLDFLKSAWRPHSCSQIQPELTAEISNQEIYNQISWETDTISFQHKGTALVKKRQSLTAGIVLKVKEVNNNLAVEVVTPENQLLNVRILNPARTVSAGKAISLKKAVRIGKDKYRLEKLDFVNPGKKSTETKAKPDLHYQLVLDAKDQEKLETFINRLVATCNKNRILPINITPLPIETVEDEQIFKREVHLPLESELLKQIEKITVPESVQIILKDS